VLVAGTSQVSVGTVSESDPEFQDENREVWPCRASIRDRKTYSNFLNAASTCSSVKACSLRLSQRSSGILPSPSFNTAVPSGTEALRYHSNAIRLRDRFNA
jgi:hypothetical protein